MLWNFFAKDIINYSSVCITKIKDEHHGQHIDCEICLIKDIKEEKRKNLNKNIESLEKLSLLLEASIKNLKVIFEKIKESKEELKTKIQKIFTKKRNELNEREDELLLEVDKKYDKLFFEEEFIKKNEKLPNKIKISLEKAKIKDSDWNDENKLNLLINDCINIENNIEDINTINKKIESYNISTTIKMEFIPKENDEINNFIKSIKTFGKFFYYNDIFKDSLIIKNNNLYKYNLIEWINPQKKMLTSLLYRKSSNGDSYETFHKLCNNKGVTLTLTEAKEGFIVGGYTPLIWENSGGWLEK